MELPAPCVPPRDAYALLTSIIVPRPIAWVSTTDGAGHHNLAPFSFFSGLGSDPPTVTLAISAHRLGGDKDSLRLMKQTRSFCISLVEEADAVAMNATSAELDPEISEFDVVGVAQAPCVAIPCVRVAHARAAMECRLVDVHRYGNKTAVNLVVGEVVHFFVADSLWDAGNRCASGTAIAPLGRLGQTFYAGLKDRLSLARPPRSPR